MFHVSQLKKVIGPVILVSPILPNELSALQVPEKILQQRVVSQGSRLVVQVLVKWSPSPESMARWEDLEPLRQRFPKATTWGTSGLSRGGTIIDRCMELTDRAGEPIEGVGHRLGERIHQLSVRVNGPEWHA
jgi:hypothetical protein